jgi:hyaluronan synthase
MTDAEAVLALQTSAAAVSGTQPSRLWTYSIYALIFAAILLIGRYQFDILVPRILAAATGTAWVEWLAYLGVFWVWLGFLLIVIRTVLWVAYRPTPSATHGTAPKLTVIIPAYNEGAMVLQSIESAARADYPCDRLEILAIDDGSEDDTWRYIREAAARYPGLVTALRHRRNKGKREALALGFARARGDVLVTIDSDSVIERGALLAIAGPFRDKRVGAVAGNVQVYNRLQGLIPRMLHVRFIISFDMRRAAESVYRNVYCCPGALTALRAEAVRSVLPRWRSQSFLGSRCTFGEDRAMTNYLLDRGYDSLYQRTAVVHTVVPRVFGKLCKMLLRWDRSYIREEFRFARIVWKRPWLTRLLASYDRFITNARYPVWYLSLGILPAVIAHDPGIIALILGVMGATSLFNVLYFLRSERSPNFVYGVLYAYFHSFALFWIFPYAIATVRARGWMTR